MRDGIRWAMCGVLAAAWVTGCSQSGAPSNGGSGDEEIKIGFLVKQPDEPWFQVEWQFAAKAGEVVRIRPGIYEGGFAFKEGVRLEGAGADRVTIRCGAREANVIKVMNCRSGSISGVTLEHLGTDLDEHRFSCLHVENSTIQVRNVTLRNAAGNGVLLTSGGATTVSNCPRTTSSAQPSCCSQPSGRGGCSCRR